MTKPVPGLVGVRLVSSNQPLKTEPNTPSPTTLSGLKFLVASLSSLKVKLLTDVNSSISSSVFRAAALTDDDVRLHMLRPDR